MARAKGLIGWCWVVLVAGLLWHGAADSHAAGVRPETQPDGRGIKPGPKKPGQSNELEMPVRIVHAICIGVQDYRSNAEFGNLPGARNDASTMHEVFTHLYQYESTLLLDEKASREAILAEIDRIAAAAGPDDAIVLYFAGHGLTVMTKDSNQIGFLLPHGTRVPEEVAAHAEALDAGEAQALATSESEASSAPPVSQQSLEKARRETRENPDWLGDRYIRVDHLRDTLLASQALHVVLLLDSCFSGAAFNILDTLPKPRSSAGNRDRANFKRLQDGSRVILTAGTADEQVYEVPAPRPLGDYVSPGRTHGVFSLELIDALTTETPNIDGQPRLAISTNELWDEVYMDVQDWSDSQSASGQYTMTPQRRLLSARHAGDFVFVRNPTDEWIERVRELVRSAVEEPGDSSPSGSTRGAGGEPHTESPSRNLTRAERARIEAAEAEARLGQAQPQLDLMTVSGQVMRARQGEPLDLKGPRWEQWAERNRRLAASGDPVASASMALAYQHGIGVPKDTRRARVWAAESRDIGHIEGRAVFELLKTGSMAEALDDVIRMLDRKDAESLGSLVTLSYVAGTAVDGEKGGRIAAAITGGLKSIGGLAREQRPDEMVSELLDARNQYISLEGTDGAAVRRERADAARGWSDAARKLERHAKDYDVTGTMYGDLGPTIAKRLRTSVSFLQRPRFGANATYQSIEDALADADRYTDELAALVLSEFVTRPE